jgi:hypothetical protein
MRSSPPISEGPLTKHGQPRLGNSGRPEIHPTRRFALAAADIGFAPDSRPFGCLRVKESSRCPTTITSIRSHPCAIGFRPRPERLLALMERARTRTPLRALRPIDFSASRLHPAVSDLGRAGCPCLQKGGSQCQRKSNYLLLTRRERRHLYPSDELIRIERVGSLALSGRMYNRCNPPPCHDADLAREAKPNPEGEPTPL